MTIHNALYSSATDEWPTPFAFFADLNREFRFTLDPCATRQNAKCPRHFTKAEDGLVQDWGRETVFCNPPYGRAISAWVKKCHQAAQAGATVVLLIPSRTDTRYFHDWIYGKAELRFVRGRLKFGDGKQSAPFPSLLAIFRPNRSGSSAA
ncbi:DNA N-6-adenine-methyltransferase [Novosphingobium naphthalenivorans]|uniref:DNA N-6-adenine-methyltransferase n=1 Tax=Novosphingobium naphthalenivorans TaxID=273168 RepID=UPI00082AE1FA|nr:DNA N-6-adenine-methyltransferase [Novosphingobium naphthalenivorans]